MRKTCESSILAWQRSVPTHRLIPSVFPFNPLRCSDSWQSFTEVNPCWAGLVSGWETIKIVFCRRHVHHNAYFFQSQYSYLTKSWPFITWGLCFLIYVFHSHFLYTSRCCAREGCKSKQATVIYAYDVSKTELGKHDQVMHSWHNSRWHWKSRQTKKQKPCWAHRTGYPRLEMSFSLCWTIDSHHLATALSSFM